jgi:hypothetical protein
LRDRQRRDQRQKSSHDHSHAISPEFRRSAGETLPAQIEVLFSRLR